MKQDIFQEMKNLIKNGYVLKIYSCLNCKVFNDCEGINYKKAGYCFIAKSKVKELTK